jgi:hypothetical protein
VGALGLREGTHGEGGGESKYLCAAGRADDWRGGVRFC